MIGFFHRDRDDPLVLHHDDPAGAHPDRPRVLLLHGMANSATVWNPLRGGALGEMAVTTADLPWRGNGVANWSHHPDPVHWVAEALTRTAAETGRVDVVVAHSYAATMLLDLLTRDDSPAAFFGLSGVVFVAPFYRAAADEFDWDTMAGLTDRFLLTMREGIRMAAGGRGNPNLHTAMAQRVCEWIGPYGWTRFFQQYLHTPWARLDRITVPSLVVSGTADIVAAPAESAVLARRLPDADLVPLSGCGHYPMIEYADEFAGVLGAFVHQFRSSPLEIAR